MLQSRRLHYACGNVLVVALALLLCGAQAFEAKIPALATVTAASVYVVNADTGQPLYEKNADKSFRSLSLTKLITATVLMQQTGGALTDRVTVLPAYLTRGSSAGLRKGDVWSMQDLLYGMLLVSGNDAALALADHVGDALLAKEKKKGGGIARFVKEMDPAAKKLGAKHSHFVDAYGMSADNVTTARDMGAIGRSVFRDKRLLPAWRCTWRTIEIGGPEARTVSLRTTIEILGEDNVIAAKTGSSYTRNIYHLAVGWLAPNGQTIVAIVLGAPSHEARYDDMHRILAALPEDYPSLGVPGGPAALVPSDAGCQ